MSTRLLKVEIPVTNTSPETWSFDVGLVVPIPTSPLSVTTNILPSIVWPPAVATPTWSLWSGFVVPMPTLDVEVGIKTSELNVDIPVTNTSPKTWSFDVGLVVPIPTSPLSVTTNILPSIVWPPAVATPTWSLWSGFVVPMPTLDVEVGIKTLELKVEIPVKVENPVTDKLSSIVTKPPKESIVKFPEVVSISLSPLIPIWILSI